MVNNKMFIFSYKNQSTAKLTNTLFGSLLN